jgi:hypothetical protein
MVMKALGFGVLGLAVVGGGGYGGSLFLLPQSAAKSQTIEVDKSAPSVLARLASAPANAPIGEGGLVTQTAVHPAANNVVTADVKFSDGGLGHATYTVTPAGEGSKVDVKLERTLNYYNPVERYQGGGGEPVAAAAAKFFPAVSADLADPKIEGKSYDGLVYSVEQVTAKPFIFNANCSPVDPAEIREAAAQSLAVLRPLLARYKLVQDGPPIAVETAWDDAEHPKQYCFQIGFAFTGEPPRIYAGGQVGQTPAGSVMRVHYEGPEENVLPTYDRMELAMWAAHVSWGRSFEVYHDDPEKPGGSVTRDIYYLLTGDASALARVVPSAPAAAAAPAAAPAAAAPAAAPAAEAPAPAPASAAPATPAPAAAPAPATPPT